MGVRGLSAYVRDTTGVSTPTQFISQNPRANALVVDGNSLVHQQQRCAEGVLAAPVLAERVVAFAKGLALVFSVTVVFDGPLPQWKQAQRVERESEKLNRLSVNNSNGVNSTTDLVSPLALVACIQALCLSSSVSVSVAEGEADLHITRTARALDALVASLDSDFLVHACRGYLPLDSIAILHDGSVCAQLWTKDMVAKRLNLDSEVLPVLAYVAGCDYTRDEKQWMAVNARLGSNSGIWRKRIRIIATHLQQAATLSEAIQSLVPQSYADRDIVIDEIQMIADIFRGNLSDEMSARYPPLPPTIHDEAIRLGRKSHKFAEIQNGIFWCQCIVEDLSRSAAWEVCRPIRRRLYAFLGVPTVGEYIRRNSEFRIEHVPAISLETGADPADPLSLYACIMGGWADSKAISAESMTLLPLISSLRFLAEAWKDTSFHLKNFEVVAIICMAVRSLSVHKIQTDSVTAAATAPTTASFPTMPPMPAMMRSKATTHLLACLETITFTSWLAWQAVYSGSLEENDPAKKSVEYAHWHMFDTSTFNAFLSQAKTGRGPQLLLSESEMVQYQVVWDAVNVADCVLEIVEYGVGDLCLGAAGGPVRRKKKRDPSGMRKTGATKSVASLLLSSGEKTAEDGNMFSVLADE
ncbi:hypothetical protein BJ741DRAFT_589421 [Chytriomyces cf. hyalinus JEL632]|nr:hypothetical protein BJ741DRAFT_589421 [Chytriomyces cf. hyalinus JEL632]